MTVQHFDYSSPQADGHVFIGVTTTGIYCRPLCRARAPRPENCRYFTSAAAAEKEGFRPCLICRPELAPGTVPLSSDENYLLAHRVAGFLEEQLAWPDSFKEAARRFGYSETDLRKRFEKAYQVTPEEYLQTARLLLAKQLFTDTGLSATEIASAVGLKSAKRLHSLLKAHYRLEPSVLRKQKSPGKKEEGTFTLFLHYRPPYLWEGLLEFFAGRAILGAESVQNGEYLRTVLLRDAKGEVVRGWLKVVHRPEKNALALTSDKNLLPVLPQVIYKIRHLFDLNCDPQIICEELSSMNDLLPGLCQPGIRRPGCFEPFEMAVRAVLGQQVTVKAASTLAARFNQVFGEPLETKVRGLDFTFPRPETILDLQDSVADRLGALGIISRRSLTIMELARAITHQTVDFSFNTRPGPEIKKLLAMPGIGEWTAHYIAMRAMGWPDAFLHTDYGVKKVLSPRTPKEILNLAETWRPYRTYANINLWYYRTLKNF